MIRRLQGEQDPTAAIIARSFCALVATKLATEVNLRHPSDVDVRVRDTKLETLSAILGRTRTEVEAYLCQPGAIEIANVVSLTSSVMKTLFTEEVPSTDILGMFRATVDTLIAGDALTSLDAELPQNLVSSFHTTYSNAQQLQAPDWLRRQLGPVSEKLFAVSDSRQGGGDLQ
ncbi:hypothetical protein EI94DRAFT_1745929, partial [Lactarius quietus]